jgi:hypothetical protein
VIESVRAWPSSSVGGSTKLSKMALIMRKSMPHL